MSPITQRDDFDGLVVDSIQIYDEDLITHDLCVTGTALLQEDLEADRVEIIGTMDVRGVFTCDEAKIAGECTCGYIFVVESAEISGSLEVVKKVSAESLEVYGRMATRSYVNVYDLDVGGEFSCIRHLHAETINVMGSFHVDGYIRTQRLMIDSHKKSYADKIQSDSVTVRKSVLSNENEETKYLLDCPRIESDTVNLVNSKIGTIVCTNGYIGPDCEIEEIYAKHHLEIDPSARVGRVVYYE